MPSDKARNTEDRLNVMIPYTYGSINTHTTQITGLNTRLGSNTQQTFLGALNQISRITQTDSGGWTSGGALNGGATQYWDNTHAAALVGWMNQVNADIAAIIAAIHASNLST